MSGKGESRKNIEGIGGREFSKEFLDETRDTVTMRSVRCGQGRIESVTPRPGARSPGPQPEILSAPDGRLGWRVRVPDSRPLATPAVANGRVYLGGGFGSHAFYCFDAESGELHWKLRTKDDGPTAATVAGDCVAFNTESCTVYVVDAATGRTRWQKWLGDPLMAQTAISDLTLFMVYPDKKEQHRLSAFDLETGEWRWESELVADVITAPVAAGDSIYATAFDGTVYRVDRESGREAWAIQHRATSAPWVHRGRVYMSLREDVEGADWEGGSAEGYDTVAVQDGARRRRTSSSRRKARYLAYKEKLEASYAHHDASVGFGSEPEAAKLRFARAHLGRGRVSSMWSFQGSRPQVFDDGIFCVLDDVAQRLELDTKKPLWRVRAESDGEESADRLLSPPAVTSSRLYFTSRLGDLFVLDRETGAELWSVNVGSAVVSQPAVAEGKVFLGTADGLLYAFETAENDARGWPMWGGGPGHNGA